MPESTDACPRCGGAWRYWSADAVRGRTCENGCVNEPLSHPEPDKTEPKNPMPESTESIELFLVFQWSEGIPPMFQGVFDEAAKAINACRTDLYCV